MGKSLTHIPVMLQPVLAGLAIQSTGIYIDATFGRGGHARAILAKLNQQGKLIIIDQDPEAIEYAKKTYSQDSRVIIIYNSFRNLLTISEILKTNYNIEKIDGILFDLGLSSPQLEDSKRGFSFLYDAPLDMRMDSTNNNLTVKDLLKKSSLKDIKQILQYYGEERYAQRIAVKIIEMRDQMNSVIETTKQLADLVKSVVPHNYSLRIHPATKTFQALRIAVNQELEALNEALCAVPKLLNIGGRLVVISFHSLEDRVVKYLVNNKLSHDLKLLDFHRPTLTEIDTNPRARSARLRIIEKI